MRDDIEWRYLKGLYKLYKEERVRNKLMGSPFIKNILYKRLHIISFKKGNMDIIEAKPRFKTYFEEELLEQYNYYADFFENSGIENSARKKYDRYELETLMFIYRHQEELKKNLTTIRIFSSNIFQQKDSKFLENRSGLLKEVKFLLQIEEFPDEGPKENQWRFVIDCLSPEAVLLCENLDYLKAYWKFTKENIELWYVGGNNTKKLKRLSKRYLTLPIYYVCDWDYHGLQIFQGVCDILKDKGVFPKLLVPPNPLFKPIDSGKHKSQWPRKDFAGLDRTYYSVEAISLISDLIAQNKWVEEQTIDSIQIIKSWAKK
ncbi:hypothetical protein [uncultured Maribacter sp.]|uniref:hypothetical protein n=1 Tax=uncultured Maribacter sp. TaxID=431308 RepID=UPI0030DB8EF6|tara:strand:+ start:3295 stop:4245 length:951 start_codon:yes stop_codon:yes gene_type:complete